METFASILTGGMLLGLAGALHCAAMCGGLASGGAMMFAPQSRAQTCLTLLAMMSGRIFVYAVLGATVAASAQFTVAIMKLHSSPIPMPWIGAVMLVWIGLSTAGLFPALAFPTSTVTTLVSSLDRVLAPVRRVPQLAPFAVGAVWGLAPCPLIYAALFTAALTGSAGAGFLWMLGFGLGTVPALAASALGIKALARTNAGPIAKVIAGLTIAFFGLAIAFLDLPVFSAICAPG